MKYVLFVCNHDAGRSQMAQAFFTRHAPADCLGRLAFARARKQSPLGKPEVPIFDACGTPSRLASSGEF